jgi:hypothetical protein
MKHTLPNPTFAAALGLALLVAGCGDRAAKNEPHSMTNAVAASTETLVPAPQPAPVSQPATPPKFDPLANLPPEVLNAIKVQVGDGEITSLERIIEDGERSFEVTMLKDQVSRAFSLDADGKLLSYQVFESELPASVQEIVRAQAGKARLGEIRRETQDQETIYAIEVVTAGQTNSLEAAESGQHWSLEIDLEQSPAPVQQTVRKLWASLEITAAHRSGEKADVVYEFEAEQENREHRLTIGLDGRLLGREDEVTLSLAPVPVQSEVKARIGAGELIRISRTTEDDQVSYDIEALKDGTPLEFSLDAAGKALEANN